MDGESCWQCVGAGGWNSCVHDCCEYDGSDDGPCPYRPRCWRSCEECEGTGRIGDADEWEPGEP